MISIKINNYVFVVKTNLSILEACKFVGISIPRFCYHETLSLAGNCRMCLVLIKIGDDEKLVVSCLTDIEEDMEILSEDPVINKAREEILEFLLLDHPLDCPICDQGGECDLQDQVNSFGLYSSKFLNNKNSTLDKPFNIFIKSIMTRCIHCTRCIRFSSEITGFDFFGTLNRGNNSEIGLYSSKNFFDSEISANVIDLCPVGALTSKPYSFKYRPWELKSTESIDVTDSLGSNIYVHSVNTSIARILPKFHNFINKSILSDKARFFNDTFDSPLLLNSYYSLKNENIPLFSFLKTFNGLKKKKLFICSSDIGFETLNLLKRISLKSNNIVLTTIETKKRSQNYYLHLNNSISNENHRLVVLFSLNIKTENALLNYRIRFLTINNYSKVYSLGFKFNSSYKQKFINMSLITLKYLLEGKVSKLSSKLLSSFSPLVMISSTILNRAFEYTFLYNFLNDLNPSLKLFYLKSSSNSSGLDYLNIDSFFRSSSIKAEEIFFFSLKESLFLAQNLQKNRTLFWFNSFKLQVLNNFNQVGIKTFFEENEIFINNEFRPQYSRKIFKNKYDLKSTYTILKSIFSLSNTLIQKSHFFFKELLSKPNLFEHFCDLNYVNKLKLFPNKYYKNSFILTLQPVKNTITSFYRTNYYTQNSKNMLLASKYKDRYTNNFL